ncbi:MAG: hypothetical protein Kilf2KO_37930 [Rhodospirillales bacterium]
MTWSPQQPTRSKDRPAGSGKAVTAASLRNQALAYLARYAASRAGVERFLLRRLARAEAQGRETVGATAIAPLLASLERLGLIDDRAFAITKANSLTRRGLSQRGVEAKLRVSGLDQEHIDAALASLEEAGVSELSRAWTYARRRRLGPYRPEAARAERRLRDLASLTRRGFTLEIARRVIDAADPPEQQTLEGEP